MKYIKAISATAVYLVLYATVYLCHIYFLPVDVVFYSALLDGVIAALLIGLFVFFHGFYSDFTRLEKVQLVFVCLLGGYIISISVPTVIDRSLSFYILEKLQQRGGSLPKNDFEKIFTFEYAREHRLVDVRLTEQQASGTVHIRDGCVSLTERGERLADFSRFFRKNLLPRRRLLMGTYTDVLTDPFRNSETAQPTQNACLRPSP